MLSQYEAQALQRSMHHELRGEPGSLTQCAAGLVVLTLLCLVGPLVEIHTEAVRILASTGILEHLLGLGL
jgi:hypothetical protein